MGLGWAAAVPASHVTAIVALVIVYVNAPFLGRGGFGMPVLALAVAAMIAERLYYVFARLLAPSGVDLWSAHPAPAMLSAMLAAAMFAAVAVPRVAILRDERARAGIEALLLVGLWGLVVMVLF